jgi:hypothetical protein
LRVSPLWLNRTTRIVTPSPSTIFSPPATFRHWLAVTPCAAAWRHDETPPIIGAPVIFDQVGVSQLWSK